MSKKLAILMSVLLALVLVPVFLHTASAETKSGTCGENLTWTFDSETGTLTIEGNGKMYPAWTYNDDYPWDGYRDQIKTVQIGRNVTSIGCYAFCNCTSLTQITIPNSVECISRLAFYGSGLTSVTIPAGTTTVEYMAFAGCPNFTKFIVDSGNTAYCTVDDVLFTIDQSVLMAYPCGKNAESYRVPESVETIWTGAFSNCQHLQTIVIPNTVTHIYDSAFQLCQSLVSIDLPDSLTTISSQVFRECPMLASVSIPDNITSIGERAFSGCTALTTIVIPDGLTSISEYAFSGCSGLISIIIPENFQIFWTGAFYNCDHLSDVFYKGTEEQKATIVICGYNDPLKNATWHYNSTGEEFSSFDGKIEWNSEDVQFKGTTPYVIANGTAQTPRFTVKDKNGKTVDAKHYTYKYQENTNAGTGYLTITFKSKYKGTAQAFFKIYLPATTATTVENAADGIYLTWKPVEGAAGYVIYRRAWNLKSAGWTDFVRWNNTTELSWTDKTVYAGTRYQYGIKAYFAKRTDPVSGAEIGGNVGDNFNLGMVGPLKTTVRITTRKLSKVTAGTKKMTVSWEGSKMFTGYEIQYALNSKFTKSVKTVKITDAATYKKVIKSLKTGKKYYVRVRSYHVFEGMTYFGQWSNTKSCTVK